MGQIKAPQKCLFVLVAYSADSTALTWGAQQLKNYGEISLQSPIIPFNDTSYYEKSMGKDLLIQLFTFSLINPHQLSEIKHHTNQLELDYKALSKSELARPLNLDPGYLNAHKFVLATTKDADHRLYLADGIYAESTLHYANGIWQDWAWTYANYRRLDHKAFLLKARKYYLNLIK